MTTTGRDRYMSTRRRALNRWWARGRRDRQWRFPRDRSRGRHRRRIIGGRLTDSRRIEGRLRKSCWRK
jgi:hypothetical protein